LFVTFGGSPALSITFHCGLQTPGIWGMTVNDALPFSYQETQDAIFQQITPTLLVLFNSYGPGFTWAPGDTVSITVRYP